VAGKILPASTPRGSRASRPSKSSGTAGGTKYGYDKIGKPFLTKEPKLLLNDNDAGKPERIHMMIGHRPVIAFGNSTGDRQMLEYTKAGDGARIALQCCTTMRCANMPMDQPKDFHPQRSERLPRRSTMKRKRTLDNHEHEERLEADLRI
jgi:hypothetical protein